MPLITTLANASARGYGGLLAAAAGGGPSYESIATTTVGSGGVSSVSFSSIPSTFEHLQIRYSTTANTGSNFFINFNSDTTTANYKNHTMTGYGYAIDGDASDTRFIGISQSSFPGVGVVDILDYKNTNKYKTTRFLSGSDGNGGTCRMQFGSVLYMSTTAISALQIVCDGTIEQYSKFALYGIKGV